MRKMEIRIRTLYLPADMKIHESWFLLMSARGRFFGFTGAALAVEPAGSKSPSSELPDCTTIAGALFYNP